MVEESLAKQAALKSERDGLGRELADAQRREREAGEREVVARDGYETQLCELQAEAARLRRLAVNTLCV